MRSLIIIGVDLFIGYLIVRMLDYVERYSMWLLIICILGALLTGSGLLIHAIGLLGEFGALLPFIMATSGVFTGAGIITIIASIVYRVKHKEG